MACVCTALEFPAHKGFPGPSFSEAMTAEPLPDVYKCWLSGAWWGAGE